MAIYQAEYYLGGNCIRQNIWIGIIRVEIFRVGIIMGANFPGRIVRVGVTLGENFLWWELSGWDLSGGNHLGGNFPGGSLHVTRDVV